MRYPKAELTSPAVTSRVILPTDVVVRQGGMGKVVREKGVARDKRVVRDKSKSEDCTHLCD